MLDADSAAFGRYGFLEPPFVEGPDVRFTYRSASLTEAVAAVLNRIARGDRVIAVTGVPGIGKTTLCMELSRQLAQESAAFERRVVVLDDAHALDRERLRERLLADATSEQRLTQTVLVGLPQLEKSLEHAGCVEGAINAIRLGPLDEHEISEYIERRMWVARGGIEKFRESLVGDDADGRQPFMCGPRVSARAARRVAAATDGNPRAVNRICADEIALAAARRPATGLLRRLAWYAIAAGLVALAMMPSVYSRRSSAHNGEARPAAQIRADEPFDVFRGRVVQHATELAAVPDVSELLRLRAAVVTRARDSRDPQQAITDLLKAIDRITNDARAKQLQLDHRQMPEYAKQH